MKNIKLIIFTLCIVVLSACASSDTGSNGDLTGSEQKELVIVDFGGASSDAFKKAMYDPFAEQNDVDITVVSPVDYGQLKSMIESGNVTWDVITADTDIALQLAAEGMLEKLDYSIIDSTNIEPSVVSEYTIGNYLSATSISYNTDLINGETPQTWADVWDTEKFPGARTFWKYPLTVMEVALLADGVDPKNLYPLDIDRAFNSLDKIKDHVNVWWSAGAQSIEMLNAKDVSVAGAWNGRILDAKLQGANLDVEYNQAVVMTDSYIIPKGAPNKEVAQEYIAFATQPEPQAEFAKLMHYAPTNKEAYDLLSEEEKVLLGADQEGQIHVDYSWWVDNFDAVNDRFNKWLLE